jgi:hypothetical protein
MTCEYNRPAGAGRTNISGDLLLMNAGLAKPIPAIWFIPGAPTGSICMLQRGRT